MIKLTTEEVAILEETHRMVTGFTHQQIEAMGMNAIEQRRLETQREAKLAAFSSLVERLDWTRNIIDWIRRREPDEPRRFVRNALAWWERNVDLTPDQREEVKEAKDSQMRSGDGAALMLEFGAWVTGALDNKFTIPQRGARKAAWVWLLKLDLVFDDGESAGMTSAGESFFEQLLARQSSTLK